MPRYTIKDRETEQIRLELSKNDANDLSIFADGRTLLFIKNGYLSPTVTGLTIHPAFIFDSEISPGTWFFINRLIMEP